MASSFKTISFSHIYRQLNKEAVALLKEVQQVVEVTLILEKNKAEIISISEIRFSIYATCKNLSAFSV